MYNYLQAIYRVVDETSRKRLLTFTTYTSYRVVLTLSATGFNFYANIP